MHELHTCAHTAIEYIRPGLWSVRPGQHLPTYGSTLLFVCGFCFMFQESHISKLKNVKFQIQQMLAFQTFQNTRSSDMTNNMFKDVPIMFLIFLKYLRGPTKQTDTCDQRADTTETAA